MGVKVFAELRGRKFRNGEQLWPFIPKTKSYKLGFYAGLGQSLVLYHFGIDYVFLCYVFVLPSHKWEANREEKLAQNISITDGLADEHSEWSVAYEGIMTGPVSKRNLPLGYIQLAVLIDNPVSLFVIRKENAVCNTEGETV